MINIITSIMHICDALHQQCRAHQYDLDCYAILDDPMQPGDWASLQVQAGHITDCVAGLYDQLAELDGRLAAIL